MNVLAVDAQSNFLIFRQRKYAIPGLTLSPVGGFIEIGESPYDAARREVREELGVGSRRDVAAAAEVEAREEARAEKEEDYGSTKEGGLAEEGEDYEDHNNHDDDNDPPDGGVTDEDPDWTYLGVYRTAANRGGGFLHSYLLRNAMPIGTGEGGTESYLGTGDDERQDLVRMTREEISDAVMGGEFKEIKWAATVALAMMHLNRLDASFPALDDVVDVIFG